MKYASAGRHGGEKQTAAAVCKSIIVRGHSVLCVDTECPLQICQLSRSSESTHFLSLRRDVALFDSTRAPDGF